MDRSLGRVALAGIAVVTALVLFSNRNSGVSLESRRVLAAAPEGWGALSGQIMLTGTLPEVPPVIKKNDPKAKDAAVCAAHDVPDDSLVVDPKSGGLQNVFVYLRRKPSQIHPDLASSKKKEIVFDQLGCRFVPHCLAVRLDQTLLLASSDKVSHNTNIQGGPFGAINQLIPPGAKSIEFKFKRRAPVPVPVACNIHPWMKAWILPMDHPYFAVTDKNGRFSIPQLPAGEHEFRIWQERVGYVNDPDQAIMGRKWTVSIEPGKTKELIMKLEASTFASDS